ncbi:MAG: D-Ala-D-Ala carboxypeptidase family metallohydrolase, partial [bacterium]|nr:D-Ala-D-Ala carboxypeptidase family metallohydrolase [bacterium]
TDKCEINKNGYIWIKVYNYRGSGNYTLRVEEPWRPPANWVTTDYVVESPHDYPNRYDHTWTITQPGAATMSVHFTQINTERRYDYVYIYDGNDNLIERYDGYYTDIWTPPVPGDTVKIRLTTDSSVTRWGFKVDKYACPLKITITQATPPNDNTSFITQPPENRIHCIADIKPDSFDAQYNSQIEWEIDDDPRDTYQSGDPNNPQTGHDVNLQITVPPVPTAPNGRGFPLKYRIRAFVTIDNIPYTSMATYTTQDERDQCRQEYIDLVVPTTHLRSAFDQTVPQHPYGRLLDDPTLGGITDDVCNWHEWWIVANLINHVTALDNAYAGNLRVTCGYRCPLGNRRAGGAINSIHMRGMAMDFNQLSSLENYNVWVAAGQTNPVERYLHGSNGIDYGLPGNPAPTWPAPQGVIYQRGHVAW